MHILNVRGIFLGNYMCVYMCSVEDNFLFLYASIYIFVCVYSLNILDFLKKLTKNRNYQFVLYNKWGWVYECIYI